ncbi:TrkA family potassium uptake protein [Metallumcola ferriviriculae]|uniref:TrkA family potassium uptake protein n=1 Tax=Metallumcola ferriviriculae TaxID=3039180 RepID=A0AAU0USB1_9FIRM|nr:TrkA family potassium uptake protein [Desulfitibacteraceae bacterium MK1]
MRKQFAVLGLGRFGSSVAETLTELGHEVLAIDIDETKVQHLADVVTHAVQADGMDEETLRSLGVRNFDVAVVAIGKDIQANILVTVILKELGVKYIVSKAQNELHGKVLERVGADKVVYPERDMGHRVANNLVSANVLDYIELAQDYSIMEIVAPGIAHGKSLGELNLRARHGVSVLAVKTGEKINVAPGADAIIKENDVLVVVGENRAIQNLATD